MKHLVTIALLALMALPASAQFAPPPMSPSRARSDSLRSFIDHFDDGTLDSRWIEVSGSASSCSEATDLLNCDSNATGRGAGVWLDKVLPIDVDWTIAVNMEETGEALAWYVWLVSQAVGSEALLTTDTQASARISEGNSGNVILERYNTTPTRTSWDPATSTWTASTTSTVNWPQNRWRTILIVNDGANERWSYVVLEEAYPATETTHGLRIHTWTTWVDWSDTNNTGSNVRLVLGPAVTTDFDGNVNFEFVKVNIGGSRKWALVNGKDLAGPEYEIYWVQAFGGGHEDGLIWLPEDRTAPTAIALCAAATWCDDQVKDKAIAISPSGATHPYYIAVAANDGTNWQVGVYHATTLGGTITAGSNNPMIPTGGGAPEPQVSDGGCFAPDFWYDNAASEWVLVAACLDAGGEIDLHYWTNSNSDPESVNWTYQNAGPILSGSASGWDDINVSNPVCSWSGAEYLCQYAGTEAIAGIDFWGWGHASGTTLGGLSKDGSNPVQARGAGTHETAGSTPTNTTDVTVATSSDYALDSYVVMTDDGTDANYVNARVRSLPNATTVRFYQHLTVGGAPDLWRATDASVTIHGFYDTQRLLHSERFVVYMTCFHHDDGTERGFDEAVCHGLTSDYTTAPSFDWEAMVGGHSAPKPGTNTGGIIESWENITIPHKPIK